MKKIFCIVFVVCSLLASASVPVGYYRLAEGKKGAELKSALSNIVRNAKMLSYGSGEGYTWQGFYSTDRDESDNRVIDMYSAQPFYQSTFASVAGMHIEHSLPKSWWGAIENNAYKDLFHLYPAEGNINIRKNNLPLGEAAEGAYTNGVSKIGANIFGSDYTGNCFEPADEYKGDFARSYLYMSTTYEFMSNNWDSPMMLKNSYPVWQPWAIEMLLKWHHQDPVSDKELARIEKVYAIQGNRNPFIDYPDLIDYIWGDKQNVEYHFPKETAAYIAYPNRWSAVKFGVIMVGTADSRTVEIGGDNLTMPLEAKLTGRNNEFVSLNTNSLAADAVNQGATITINFNAMSHAAINDTLKLYSKEIVDTVKVPVSGIAGSDFMALPVEEITPVGATLNWMNLFSDSNYTLSLYKGASQRAGNLFISVYHEGTSYNKAIAIYNATGKSVDLSKYSIKVQSNGNGGFASEVPLSGTIDNNSTYVIAASGKYGTASEALLAVADAIGDLNFNGNDAVGLFQNDVMIDLVGVIDNAADWGKDVTLTRTTGYPSLQYNSAQWSVSKADDFDALRAYSYTASATAPELVAQKSVKENSLKIDNLDPKTLYFYNVANGDKESYNNVYFETTKLGIPEALEATNVYSNLFEANWEMVEGATSYKVELAKVTGTGSTTDIYDFTGVGSAGTPLPQGLTGTASGNYTTTTSSGASAPAIALKNNGEYLMTKTYSSPITSLKFMYRYASAGSGNKLVVEVLKGEAWSTLEELEYKNTTKQYPEYTFTTKDNVRGIKFTFQKVSGNLAIDDIEIVSGIETVDVIDTYVAKQPGYIVKNLTGLTQYQYRVAAVHNDYVSEYSSPINVTTTTITSVESVATIDLKIFVANGVITINGDSNIKVKNVSLYSMLGEKVLDTTSEYTIPATFTVSQRGVYILSITTTNGSTITTKVVL